MSYIGDRLQALRTWVTTPLSSQKAFNQPATGSAAIDYGTMGPVHEPFAGAWQRNLDGAHAAGRGLLGFSGVYAPIDIITSDISVMTPVVMRRAPAGNREIHVNHPAMKTLRDPNSFQNSMQFLQAYMISKLVHGNTFVYLLRDARGVVNEMYVLDPASVQIRVLEDGSVLYQLGRDILNGMTYPILVTGRDVLHDRMPGLFHPLVGTSPLFAAAVSAMVGSRVLANSETFFANMSRASGVLTSPNKIERDLAKKMQADWEQNYGARGLGRTAVLSNGLEFKTVSVTAADAELVNQLRWTIEDVARCFRVPGFKLGDLNKVTFKNSEQMARDYFQSCLQRHIRGIELCLTDAFELPVGTEVVMDTSSLFRMDTESRYVAHASALNAGFKSINEVRLEEDLPPVPGGEEPRVQVQYVPLSQVNAAAAAAGMVPGAPGVAPPPAKPPKPAPAAQEPNDEASKQYVEELESAARLFMDKLTGAKNGS